MAHPAAIAELWHLGARGIEDIRLQPAPTPPLDSIRLLVTGGVWVVAHVTHEALVRLRRPGVALVASGLLWFAPARRPPDRPGGLAQRPAVLRRRRAGAAARARPRRGRLDPRGDRAAAAHRRGRPDGPGRGRRAAGPVAAARVRRARPGSTSTAATEPRGYQPIVDVGDRLNLPDAPRRPRGALHACHLPAAGGPGHLRRPHVAARPARRRHLPARPRRAVPRRRRACRTRPRSATAPVVTSSVEVLDLENIYVPVPYQVDQVDGPPNSNLFYSRQGGFVATGEVEDNELRGETRVGVREGFSYEVTVLRPHADLRRPRGPGHRRGRPGRPAAGAAARLRRLRGAGRAGRRRGRRHDDHRPRAGGPGPLHRAGLGLHLLHLGARAARRRRPAPVPLRHPGRATASTSPPPWP